MFARNHTRLRLTAAAFFLACIAIVSAPLYAGTNPLDFNYEVTGPAGIRPELVFNDGRDTYVQPGGAQISIPGAQQDGPYLRVSGLADSIIARASGRTVQISWLGARTRPIGSDMATAQRPPTAQHLASTGAAVPGRQGGIKEETVAQVQKYELLKSDGVVSTAFNRWASQNEGWTVVWDTGIAAPLTGDSRVEGSFPDVVTSTVTALRSQGYPLWLSAPDPVSKAIRIYQTVDAKSVTELKK